MLYEALRERKIQLAMTGHSVKLLHEVIGLQLQQAKPPDLLPEATIMTWFVQMTLALNYMWCWHVWVDHIYVMMPMTVHCGGDFTGTLATHEHSCLPLPSLGLLFGPFFIALSFCKQVTVV